METLRFKPDVATRKRLYVNESLAHPAKGHLGMWAMMIELYSRPGDFILDPMGGSGASLIAALMGRNVICVEMEPHFVEPMRQSWEKMRQMPMLGYTLGEVAILRGDARALPLPSASVSGVVTSPPFQDQVPNHFGGNTDFSYVGGLGHEKVSGYTQPVDAIVTSPPYEESMTGDGDSLSGTAPRQGDVRKYPRKPSGGGYTRHGVDAIVTSPPFQDQEATKAGKFADPVKAAEMQSANYRTGKSKGHFASAEAILRAMDRQQPYAPNNAENIGNLRSSAYWSAMRQVYAECWRVLRPGGVMALVLKGFTRGGVYQDLPGQTEAMLLAAGWTKHDHWRRELWSLSFWRILQQRRDPAAFDERLKYEEVLAFRKPSQSLDGEDGAGLGCDGAQRANQGPGRALWRVGRAWGIP